MGSNSDIRLRWVLSDPARERAADALGTGAQADRIADLLVPQLSVTTTRARYFSFLCWAVRQSASSSHPISAIHRLEAELALEEAALHRDDANGDCPGIVGRVNAARHLRSHAGRPPVRPERLYKNTAFATYRPAMRALGLLTRGRKPELTESGGELAAAFAAARGRKPRCLGDISTREQSLLKYVLGLDKRNREPIGPAARRRATCEELGRAMIGTTAWDVIEEHARCGARSSDVAKALHRAYVWELLSLGLGLAFAMVMIGRRPSAVARKLRAALAGRPRPPELGVLEATEPDAATDVVALLRAALKLHPTKLDLEPGVVGIAERLIVHRAPNMFIEQLVARHRFAKPDGPWIALAGDKVDVLVPAKALATSVRARTYRLDAFEQILCDLGVLQS